MKCVACGFSVPLTKTNSDACMACGKTMVKQTDDFLLHGANGLVKEVRPGQVEMGRLTEKTIAERNFAVIEGPVGIGKSFAYSIPTILSGKRVVISTAKKQLQHQLAQKDLPFLGERLEKVVNVALIKGKSNYACKLRAFDLKPEDQASFLAWLDKSKSGDLSDLPGRRPPYWPEVTAEDCVGGSRCRWSKTCSYWQAKQQIKTANVIVANHHVVAYDLRFGPKKILGDYDVLIIDEAHQAVGAFRGAYTQTVTPFSVKRIIRNLDKAGLDADIKPLEKAWEAMFSHIQDLDGETPSDPFEEYGEEAVKRLMELRGAVKKELAAYGVNRDVDPDALDGDDTSTAVNANLDYILQLEILQKTIDRPLEALAQIKDPGANTVVYINTTERKSKIVNAAPINIGPMVGPKLQQISTVIVTSATIAVGGKFDDIKYQLGLNLMPKTFDEDGEPVATEGPLKKIDELILESPFDYHRQALLYTPYNVLQPVGPSTGFTLSPEREKYISSLARECKRLIRASDGNAFVLFTSTQDMKDVYAALSEEELPNPLIMQEDDAESTLREFMATPKSVVLGLKSFWEGVDVVGDKLRLVIITKLPFPQVRDPVIQARSRTVKNDALAKGMSEQNAESTVFKAVQIPMMLTDLRQGAGRLIRSKTDRGVLAILDPRVWTGSGKRLPVVGQKYVGYGAQAVSAIGFSQQTADFALVEKFLNKLRREEKL